MSVGEMRDCQFGEVGAFWPEWIVSLSPDIASLIRATTASTVNDVFVGEIISGKRLRGSNIVVREPWVVTHDCLRRHTGAKFAQN